MPRYPATILPEPYQLARRADGWWLQVLDAPASCWRDVRGPLRDRISAVRAYDALTRAERPAPNLAPTPAPGGPA